MIDIQEKFDKLPPTLERKNIRARLSFYKLDNGDVSGGYVFPEDMKLGRNVKYTEKDIHMVIDKLFNYLHG